MSISQVTGAASGVSSLQSGLNAAATGAQIGSALATTVAGITDAKQQMKAQQALANMTASQQAQLNAQIAAATDNNQKLQILVNAIVQAQNNKRSALSKGFLVPALIALGILLVGGMVLFKKKKPAA